LSHVRFRALPALFALLAFSLCALPFGGAPARAQVQAAATAAPSPPAGPGHAMVVAANPLAAEAGLRVLKAGGSAADAAVAIQMVLGLVEPQSSGPAGGAFMTYYDARTRTVTAYNGRERAPAGARADMLEKPDGTAYSYFDLMISGRTTGAPGATAMLGLAQQQHGVLPWKDLFGYAEDLAANGFAVSPRLDSFIHLFEMPETNAPDVAAYFTKPSGERYKTGDVLKNPAYAATLRGLAAAGPRYLYEGQMAQDIAAAVHAAPMPGTLTVADIAAYRPRAEPALCRPYRIYVVCVPPPPSSGVILLQGLMILEHTDIASRGPDDPQAWSELAQTLRLMFADQGRYVADPGFITVPVAGLLDPAYVAGRAALIGAAGIGPAPAPGLPPGAPPRGKDATHEPGGTSHFVVVDARGDVASMTTSVNTIFGSGHMAGGMMMNDQLLDFSFLPVDADGAASANAVAPGKQPRSSMTPVIVLDRQGRFVAALGSPGGPGILAYNLKTLVGLLDWGLPMAKAVALPNLVPRGATIMGETDLMSPALLKGLADRGIVLKPSQSEPSGLHGVVVRGGKLQGGADPRREGVVLGF
jgi:gamma-glutamyltranspeptidase/glutathione hydrolase